jgi:hypothetical protein
LLERLKGSKEYILLQNRIYCCEMGGLLANNGAKNLQETVYAQAVKACEKEGEEIPLMILAEKIETDALKVTKIIIATEQDSDAMAGHIEHYLSLLLPFEKCVQDKLDSSKPNFSTLLAIRDTKHVEAILDAGRDEEIVNAEYESLREAFISKNNSCYLFCFTYRKLCQNVDLLLIVISF